MQRSLCGLDQAERYHFTSVYLFDCFWSVLVLFMWSHWCLSIDQNENEYLPTSVETKSENLA